MSYHRNTSLGLDIATAIGMKVGQASKVSSKSQSPEGEAMARTAAAWPRCGPDCAGYLYQFKNGSKICSKSWDRKLYGAVVRERLYGNAPKNTEGPENTEDPGVLPSPSVPTGVYYAGAAAVVVVALLLLR